MKGIIGLWNYPILNTLMQKYHRHRLVWKDVAIITSGNPDLESNMLLVSAPNITPFSVKTTRDITIEVVDEHGHEINVGGTIEKGRTRGYIPYEEAGKTVYYKLVS